jgi:aminobenzoyl-glutamate utilization protein B
MANSEMFELNRRGFLATTAASLLAGAAAAPGMATQAAAADASPPASSDMAAAAVEASKDAILRISREVWDLAEVSLVEVKSADVHRRELTAAGFTLTQQRTKSHPTAFVAEWTNGTGGAKVGFMPEYDALPGLGNKAEPKPTYTGTDAPAGHGCGHNMIGAGCTGAAFALKSMMEKNNIPGTIRVYGCAAEETEGVKVYMAREGVFADLDACLAWHPAPIAAVGELNMNATDNIKVRFKGRTAHAGNSPWDGRSALKAAEMFGIGVQMMREHILPTARLHYIYESAGVAPNVVPEYAQLWMTIRDADRTKVEAMTKWLREIAQGVAMATQTEAEVQMFFGMWQVLYNTPVIEQINRHLLATPLDWTPEEQEFARACQKQMGLPEAGMATKVLPILKGVSAGASTDLGDVSYNTPLGVFGWPTMPLGTSLHTWAVTACGGMSIGDKCSLQTAKILAGVGYDIMTDEALRKAMRADFQKRLGDTKFVSPLPPDQTEPLDLPQWLRKTGKDEIVSNIAQES